MVIILLFLVLKRYVFDDGKLNSQYKFTQAIVYKISYPSDGGPDAEFKFCVDQIEYKSYILFNPTQQKVTVGKNFLLKYYPPNPKIARILLDKPLLLKTTTEQMINTCK